jgi:hypothetical protein
MLDGRGDSSAFCAEAATILARTVQWARKHSMSRVSKHLTSCWMAMLCTYALRATVLFAPAAKLTAATAASSAVSPVYLAKECIALAQLGLLFGGAAATLVSCGLTFELSRPRRQVL